MIEREVIINDRKYLILCEDEDSFNEKVKSIIQSEAEDGSTD